MNANADTRTLQRAEEVGAPGRAPARRRAILKDFALKGQDAVNRGQRRRCARGRQTPPRLLDPEAGRMTIIARSINFPGATVLYKNILKNG